MNYFSDLSKEQFRFVIPCVFALSLVLENGIIKADNPMEPYYVDRIGGDMVIDDCIYHLNCFFSDTDYINFFKKNKRMYNDYLKSYKDIICKIMADIQTWYNCQDITLTAYVSHLIHPGGFCVSRFHNHVKCAIGSVLNKDNSIEISLCYNVCFHEFSHHFVDRYVKNNWNSIKMLFKDNIYTILNSDDVYCQQEFICETIIRALSNYYCDKNHLNINISDFLCYPLSKHLFQVLKKEDKLCIDNCVYDMLLTSMAKKMNKGECP